MRMYAVYGQTYVGSWVGMYLCAYEDIQQPMRVYVRLLDLPRTATLGSAGGVARGDLARHSMGVWVTNDVLKIA